MSNMIQNQYMPDYVSPPGETLLETMEALGMSQAELAERTGRPKKTINEIINGKAAITPETALQFEKVLGVPAAFWNKRESNYREALARHDQREQLGNFVGWLNDLPISDMVNFGWIKRFRDPIQQIEEVLHFFGIASPEQWKNLAKKYSQEGLALRTSPAFKSDPLAVVAWLRKGELEAHNIDCASYNISKFRGNLTIIRGLTTRPPEVYLRKLVELCAEAGVAVAFVPELPRRTRTSGATLWLTPKKALMQFSFRYQTDDQFWFTFFHESAHILSGRRKIFLEDEYTNYSQVEEQQANRFAEKSLIPEGKIKKFMALRPRSKSVIKTFANNIGIAPGIVVGRLQREAVLPYTHLNGLKIRLDWETWKSGQK